MDTQELLALYDKEQRIDIEYPDMRKEVLPHVMSRPIVTRHGFHLLTYAHACEWKASP